MIKLVRLQMGIFSTSAPSLRNLGEIKSKPVLLLELKLDNSLYTLLSYMLHPVSHFYSIYTIYPGNTLQLDQC